MEIKPFGVEEWMTEYEHDVKYNVAETCVDSFKLKEILELTDEKDKHLRKLLETRVDYGYIPGSLRLRKAIASLYKNASPENIITTTGGIGANFLAIFTIVNPKDKVISVWPTYQQLISLPQSFGAEVKILYLKEENNFLPDLDELKKLCEGGVDLICINNPNNPTGALIKEDMLKEIIEIAKKYDAYILCDEVYRGLEHEKPYSTPSIFDLYEKGISTGSLSKVYSAAGLRTGWITANKNIIKEISKRRDYTTISCGKLDDHLSAILIENKDKVLNRNLAIIRENKDILLKWIDKNPKLSVVPPQAGTTVFMKYDYDIPSDKLCLKLINEKSVFYVPGAVFSKEYEKYIRIGYACKTQTLKEALKLTEELFKSL